MAGTYAIAFGITVTVTTILITVDRLATPGLQNHNTMIRNQLVKVAYEHEMNTLFHRDKLEENYDVEKWYNCKVEELSPASSSKFIKLGLDKGTRDFLDRSYEKSDWLLTQMWHSMVKSFASWFASATSINGWLGRGCMFIFSRAHFFQLLDRPDTWTADNLLDLGAGDGGVTMVMAPTFQNVSATEASGPMRKRLSSHGYSVLDIQDWSQCPSHYDVISCLNLLDRCDRPNSILRDIRKCLKPGGLAIIALVLPYKPFVEYGSKRLQPEERLSITGRTWEEQVNSFIEVVAPQNGFEVLRFTKLPYLCEGDLSVPFYYLIDAVFVLRPTNGS